MLVSTCVAFAALLFDECSCNLCVLSTQALQLSKMAEKIIAEEEGSFALRMRVAELEEANTQLKASEAEMQKTIDNSSVVVTLLRHELNEEIENYDLLKNDNDSLLEERNNVRYEVADLESELEKVGASVADDISALEARLALRGTLPLWRNAL
jgi:DNA repair exonuclease SbcCD ATPase subunit